MKLPVDGKDESQLVLIDLVCCKTGDFAPGTGGIVAVLKVLGRENQSSEKHAAAALESTTLMTVVRLFHGEIVLGDMGLDQDEIVQGDLERGVAGARSAERLLDEGAQGQNGLAADIIVADDRRKWPDGFDDLCRGINKCVHKVDFAVALADECGGCSRTRAVGSPGVLAQLGRDSRWCLVACNGAACGGIRVA